MNEHDTENYKEIPGGKKHTYYPIDFPIGEGKTDYEKYLRVPELLSLQKTPENFTSQEELLFQIVHQTSELWMKQMLYDLERAIKYMDAGKYAMAVRCLRLVSDIQIILTMQVDMLGRNLSIVEYEHIREGLGRGSGMESPGFNRLLDIAPKLREAFLRVMDRCGIPLKDIYRNYEDHIELHNLCEYLVDFDDQFHKWRTHHMDLVRRTIGLESNSLKGIPSKVLQRGVIERFFPELFDIRNTLTNESTLAYGGQPLEK